MNERDKTIVNVARAIDELILVPLSNWPLILGHPIAELYRLSQTKVQTGKPLSLLVAEKLKETVKPKDNVIITTGFVTPPYFVGETDGPPGAAALARAINVGLKATPVLVTEEVLTGMVSATCQSAGLLGYNLEKASTCLGRFAIRDFPTNPEKGDDFANKMLDEVKPSAIISIERAGRNEKGVYHSGRGEDISSVTSKVDFLMDEARSRGILTIGVGDLGNEIGMGSIKSAIERLAPELAVCTCPCKGSRISVTETGILLPATISNWGGYGIEASLALLLREPRVLHDELAEELMLRASAQAGAIDSNSGLAIPAVDGASEDVNKSIVKLLRSLVERGLRALVAQEKK